jgi:excisionase family DNA binding protein
MKTPLPVARLIDPIEVADRLGVSVRYVRRLVAERRIRYTKVGHLVRFDPADVQAWLKASTVNAQNGPHLSLPRTSPASHRSSDSRRLLRQ